MEVEVSTYWTDLPEQHHQKLFEIFHKLVNESEITSEVQVTQEPYETPMSVIKVDCGQNSKAEIIRIIGKLTRKEKFYVTFLSQPDHQYQPLCNLQIEDFHLGSFNLAKFEFYQRFRHSVQFKSASKPRLIIAFDREQMYVDFAISHQPIVEDEIEETPPEDANKTKPTTEVYQLRLKFSMIEKNQVVIHEHEEKGNAAVADNARHRGGQKSLTDIYFLLKSPLELWRTKQGLKRVEAVNDDIRWIKTVLLKSEIESLKKVNLSVLLGGSRVLKISVDQKDPNYATLMRSLHSNGFILKYGNIAKTTQPQQLPYCFRTGTKNFNCDWYLQALFSLGFHTQLQFTPDLRRYILSKEKDDGFLPALDQAYIKIMANQHLGILRTVQYFFDNPRRLDESTPRYNCYIRRIVVTPTRSVYLPQSLMHENRILREFDREYALSVTFRNDDYTKLNDQFSSREFIEETILGTLMKGISISDRPYQFLGCSGSQQRNHACWLYAKDPKGNDATSILGWVGNLDNVVIPGKYISRVGQCFSRTKPVDLSEFPDLVLKLDEPDITGGNYDYCFTDGVGRISKDMLIEVFARLDEPYVPSAFQIRLGGCKGMLAVDPTLEGQQILIRKSMNKFESEHRQLEIMRVALPMRLKLNRQIVTLLALHRGDIGSREATNCRNNSQLSGIEGGDQEFRSLLLKMLFDLADTFLDDHKAAESLGSRCSFSCPFTDLVNAGLSLTDDTFFRNMTLTVTREAVYNILDRFHVELPVDQARNMFGIADETGTLKYGQVFVRYSADVASPGQNPLVVTGPVLVSKMPCLHPGDARVLTAVDVPQLHHHVDCIVFPVKGPRPHPDEMAGSDLDGDEYFVTWKPELMLRYGNCSPMNYSAVAPPPASVGGGTVKKEDMINYLVKFVSSDQIGPVASRHLVWADREGLYSQQCLDLCQLHSDVIDSGKTGATIDRLNERRDLISYKYPDFMNKMDHKDSYKSQSVLGRFFRISRRVHVILSDELQSGMKMDERLLMPGHEDFMTEAEELRTMYEDSVERILTEYGVDNEVELLSGCIITLTSPLAKAEGDSDRHYKLKQLIQDRMMTLIDQIRTKFYTDLGITMNKVTVSSLRKASACYRVTYGEKRKLMSFPWIFGELLVEVMKNSQGDVQCDSAIHNPYHVRLDQSIESISEQEMNAYLSRNKSHTLRHTGPGKRILYILLKWFKWAGLGTVCGQKDFITMVESTIRECQSEPTASRLLVSVMKQLGLRYSGKNSEDFSREVAMGIFKLALHCSWNALNSDSSESRQANQTIMIPKYRWLDVKDRVGSFSRSLESWYPRCSFKFRSYGHSGLLHVRGPALDVFKFMDNSDSCHKRFIKRK